jgi:CdiI N-terminal domain
MREVMFDIYLTGEKVTEEDDPEFEGVWGEIRIGEFLEGFVASVITWTAEQYEKQWQTALGRIAAGSTPSALITEYIEPSQASGSFLQWWALYREGHLVYIQNHLRALYCKGDSVYMQNQLACSDPLDRQFFLERSWELVGERKVVGAEGSKISEWATTVQSIEETLVRRFK